MKRLTIALTVLVALVMADITTTLIGLSRGAGDLNPLYHAQGLVAFLICKVATLLVALPVYAVAYRYTKVKFPKYVKVVWLCLAFLVGFYSVILVNNLLVLTKLL
jgi:hypothetical protein